MKHLRHCFETERISPAQLRCLPCGHLLICFRCSLRTLDLRLVLFERHKVVVPQRFCKVAVQLKISSGFLGKLCAVNGVDVIYFCGVSSVINQQCSIYQHQHQPLGDTTASVRQLEGAEAMPCQTALASLRTSDVPLAFSAAVGGREGA